MEDKLKALKEENQKLKEELEFYKNIVNRLPAIVYINELDESGNINSLKNVWSNQRALDFIGYTQEEITGMGFEFMKRTIHPDDLEVSEQPLPLLKIDNDFVYIGINRQKPRNGNEYIWLTGRCIVLDYHSNGFPKRSLNVAFVLYDQIHSDNQLISALNEINRLKHQVKLKELTSREKEIAKCIASGMTDKEISNKLNISIKTSKTHRHNLLKKLGIKNSACLAAFATECGLI